MSDIKYKIAYWLYFCWLRMTLHWYTTCSVKDHDWFPCAVLDDGSWTRYWRCDRCHTTQQVDAGLPAPRPLAEDTKPPAFLR